MSAVLLIARNVLRAILSRSALYIWAAGLLLMFLRSGPAIFVQNRSPETMLFMRANAVSGSLDMWSFGCIAAAIFLGANMVAGDLVTKRAVTVLARPLHRWQFLTGKLLGIFVFLVLTLAVGVGLALALAAYLGIEVDIAVLGAAIPQTLVAIIVFGAVASAAGSFGSAVAAVGLSVLLVFLPTLISTMRDDPDAKIAAVGKTLDALVPDSYRSHYNAVAWAPFPVPPNMRNLQGPAAAAIQQRQRRPPEIDYADERKMLAANLGYALVYFALGCWAFSRRDLSLT
jgi:ABC-type transport system involved in multi-copper enzyme maturation permease subunit